MEWIFKMTEVLKENNVKFCTLKLDIQDVRAYRSQIREKFLIVTYEDMYFLAMINSVGIEITCDEYIRLQSANYKTISEESKTVKVGDAITPDHYGGADNPYEVIKVCEAWGLDKDAYLFNVVKYVARAGKKDPTKELEDLKKAQNYLNRKINNLEK